MKMERDHLCKKVDVREVHDFDASILLGAPFPVVLGNGVEEKYCPECGKVHGIILEKPKELVAIISVMRACDPKKLRGSEIKFLRKSMGLKAKELAEKIALTPESLSRFENGKQAISEVYEKLFRAVVCLHHWEDAVGLQIDMRGLLSMSIPGVCTSDEEVGFYLSLQEAEVGREPVIPPPAQTILQKWHVDHSAKIAS